MKRVELYMAYYWICERCSFRNFSLPQKAEMTDEDRELSYRKFNDLEDWADLPEDWRNFELCHIPYKVECSNCHEVFLTKDEEHV